MAATKDNCVELVEKVRTSGLEVASAIVEANKSPNNAMQIEALKVALEMYKTFAVKA